MPDPILIVMRDDRRTAVFRAASDLAAGALVAADCEQARRIIRSKPNIDAVITDLSLRDGNWYCIHQELVNAGLPAECIVLLPDEADEAAAVLDHGAFAAVAPPWPATHLKRLVDRARRRSCVAVGSPP